MAKRDMWVFGYGSLMWDPGFPWLERKPAMLRGYHRAMCIYSYVWRGTMARPGLVLGLDRGGTCRGIAFRVAGDVSALVIKHLDKRERVTEVYKRRTLPVTLETPKGGPAEKKPVPAVAYIADRQHGQYAGKLADEDAARLIRQGQGRGGANIHYLENTVQHLDELGIPDGPIHELYRYIRGGS
ncbi:MAG: gamma-glutamylcyclotransferase [Rhodospirillales bacterium]|jgi:glutathione-specific gamma-glutamylcyclotransferase|nr:gamma-glutamylcyclotransferase [Rhodospirillales bacterium]MBT4006740.1 gamma-glutamylcyclotransferase [Rhodospirillales bacterium]MBT5076798.1 gamma-glutamylcyclotransferase [Rhodospirillales bacterium]MBT5114018.1 gamma-glutamylcyclotransferase [Rhodospirillales bacterium]MBT5672546.1 gamma-glutamylcyclotransferase [Rhodospirillales bacterium]